MWPTARIMFDPCVSVKSLQWLSSADHFLANMVSH